MSFQFSGMEGGNITGEEIKKFSSCSPRQACFSQTWRSKFLPYLQNRMSVNILYWVKCFHSFSLFKGFFLEIQFLTLILSLVVRRVKIFVHQFQEPIHLVFILCLISGSFVIKKKSTPFIETSFGKAIFLQKLSCRIFFFSFELYIDFENGVQKKRHITKKPQ